MNKRIEIIRIINNCMIWSVCYMTILAGMECPLGNTMFFSALILVGFVLISEVIGYFVKNLVLFLVAHIAAMAVCTSLVPKAFLFSDAMSRIYIGGIFAGHVAAVIAGIFMFGAALVAIYSRLDGKGRFYPEIYEGFLFIVLFLFFRITSHREVEGIVLLAEILWAVLIIIFYNARQTIGALVTFHERDFLPSEQIRKNNSIMLRISLIIAGVVMFICAALDYGKEIFDALKRGIITFLRWLFSHFNFEEVEEYEDPVADAGGGGFGMLLPENYVDDSIWHKIWNALFWVVAAIVTVLIIYLLVKLIQQFYKIFNSSRIGLRDRLSRDKKEFLNPLEDGKDNTFSGNKSGRIPLFERLSPRGRVRRMFVKHIRQGQGFSEIRNSSTPLEMEVLSTGAKTQAYEIYEKARYSSEEISAEDLEKMKASIER